jgi:Cu(I)/Ag(I) efflux system membrane fusion protein
MSKSRVILTVVFLPLLCALSLQAQEIQWGSLQTGKLVNDLRVPGHVIPEENALSIESARVPGRITDILKREGEVVRAGDPLFAVSSAECISLAEELRMAQNRNLPDLIAGSQQREKQLGLSVSGEVCEILATHPGTLIKRNIDLGGSFNVGDPLATILDLNSLTVELAVSERDMASIRVGQPVSMELASSPGRTLRSRIAHILPTIDPTTRTTKVRVAPVPLPEGTTLDALVFARINVGSGEPTFEVPSTALVFHQNQRYVMKKGPPAAAVPVDVLDETQTTSSILPTRPGALHPGDSIATSGAIYLYNEINPSAQ